LLGNFFSTTLGPTTNQYKIKFIACQKLRNQFGIAV